ncbi:hypothetical protein M197_gp34 [Haloarcula hispanica tailed virus 2]|uniref:Uncharacterized protein n=1 Tax=Haloarcula hispanica tailed virus 2 TaxID=1273751 RepID=R4T687_9CAUD|nr:hypothetical protein M197_gp34 [Haloarcula hispanica tailed virus 2]AGM11199.1 hypothetical protein HHTV2_34 [Haloarcula hispanica tailed virus 2]
MPGDKTPEQIARALRGPYTINDSLNVASLKGLWNFQPDRPLTDRQDFDPFNVWYEEGTGSVGRANQLYQLDSGGTAGGRAVMETAQLGVYRSGAESQMGIGLYVDQRPTGDGYIDVAYTREGQAGTSDELAWRITADDLTFRISSDLHPLVTLSQNAGHFEQGAAEVIEDGGTPIGKVYGLDPIDGSGPSRIDYTPSRGYVYGIIPGWYGPSATMGYIKEVGDVAGQWSQRVWPLFLYRPYTDPAIERPNHPGHVAVDNGTTDESVQARLGGRQFHTNGDIPDRSEPTHDWATDQTLPMDGTGVGESDWYVVAVVKRKPGYGSTAIGLAEFALASDSQPLAVQARVVDPTYLSGTSYRSPTDHDENQTALEFDMDSATPADVTLASYTDTDGIDKPQGIAWDGDIIGAGEKQEARFGRLGGGFAFPVVRQYPTVFLATTRTGTSDDVDSSIRLNEVG